VPAPSLTYMINFKCSHQRHELPDVQLIQNVHVNICASVNIYISSSMIEEKRLKQTQIYCRSPVRLWI